MIELNLYIGSKFTGITVQPDAKWPGMWRIHQHDLASDMVNIARAKDAAIVWARPRGLAGTEVVHWRRREMPPEALQGASGKGAAT